MASSLAPTRAKSLLPVFLRPRAILRFLRDSRASPASKIFFLVAILYVAFPLDLVPDVAPVIGWLDDAGVFTASLAWIMNRVAKYEREHPEQAEGT
jgi:uncharacterized membrane protein YkvA (DUF1232 family)